MTKVSIIIPVYNAAKYLSIALNSALDQSFVDFELICVNDGSTDSSQKILEQFQAKDDRVKIISRANGGGSAARNTGMRHAKGEYVMFLDSDDLLANDIVQRAYDIANETKADVVFYNFARFVGRPTKLASPDATIPETRRDIYTKDNDSKRFLNDFAILTWNKLIRRDLLEQKNVQFDTSLSHDHDVDFSIRLMLAAETFSYIDTIGYYYRVDSSQSLTSTKYKDPANVLRIILTLNDLIKKQYPNLKQSFDNYAAGMIVGAINRQRDHPESQREVFDFAHRKAVIDLGLANKDESYFYKKEQAEYVAIVAGGNYDELIAKDNRIGQKIRRGVRKLHGFIQRILGAVRV